MPESAFFSGSFAMNSIDGTEIWRTIPPEEKIAGMNKAHARGILAAAVTIMICGTISVGLRLSWILWGSLIAAPFVFQFAAGKAWRDLRPRLILEYLAARSAARRYAFAAKSKDLTLSLIFRGNMELQFESEAVQEAIEAAISKNEETLSWIALFTDAVVVMEEHPGGARLAFAAVTNDRLSLKVNEIESGRSGPGEKELILSYTPKPGSNERARKFKLKSPYPAALTVFEKRLQQTLAKAAEAAAALPPPEFKEPPPSDEDYDSAQY